MDVLRNLIKSPTWVLIRCKITHPDVSWRENTYNNLIKFSHDFNGKKGFTSFILNDYCVYYMAFLSDKFTEFEQYVNNTVFVPKIQFEIVDPAHYELYNNPNTPKAIIEKSLNDFECTAVLDYNRNRNNKHYNCQAFFINQNELDNFN